MACLALGREAEGGVLVPSWQEAESRAAAWMQTHGFPDARVTQSGADSGVDVVAKGAVAQVKAFADGKKVGRPDLQRLYGVATAESSDGLFFSASGYTVEALDWGRRVGLALFSEENGRIEPLTPAARSVAGDTSRPARRGTEDPRVQLVLDMLSRTDRTVYREQAIALGPMLEPRETIRAACEARKSGTGLGLLVVTSRRLLFASRKMLRAGLPVAAYQPAYMAQFKVVSRGGIKFICNGQKVKFSVSSKRKLNELLAAVRRWRF